MTQQSVLLPLALVEANALAFKHKAYNRTISLRMLHVTQQHQREKILSRRGEKITPARVPAAAAQQQRQHLAPPIPRLRIIVVATSMCDVASYEEARRINTLVLVNETRHR